MKRALLWTAYSLASLIVLLAIVVAGGYFYFATHINRYTLRVEHIAGQRLGEPVAIGSIAMGWHGFGVEVDLKNVAVLSADRSQRLIQAKRVRVDLNPLSFVSWPQVHPVFIGVAAPRLTVVQGMNGQLRIVGLPQGSGAAPSFNDIVNMLDQVGTIAVTDGTIVLNAPAHKIKGWQFHDLDAHVSGSTPHVQLSLKLPEAMGQSLDGHVAFTRSQPHGEWHWQGHLKLAGLRLESVPMLASNVPLDLHGGEVNLTLSGHGDGLQPAAVQGQVRPLPSNGADASTLTADLDWNAASGGQLALAGGNMAIDFPGLFRAPIPLTQAKLPLTFRHEAAGWRIVSDQFRLANADIATAGHFSVLLPAGGGAPVLDVEATASGIDLVHKSEYLPVGIMPPSVTAWVDRSVKSGQVPRVQVIFRGAADQFPFRDRNGLFKVDFDLTDTRIKFDPHWPAVTKLNAEVIFKDEGLSATVHSGTISGMAMGGSQAKIADLAAAVLKVTGTARGDAAEAMDFLRHSPIAKKFGPYITKTEAHGKLDVDVKINLPLADIGKFQVHGQAHLHDVDTKLAALLQGFKNLKGQLDFTDAGLNSPTGLTGEFLGEPVAITVHPAPHRAATTQISLTGSATAAELTKALGAPHADVARGKFGWHAQVLLPNEFAAGSAPLTVSAQSNLKGLELKLPAPFAKPGPKAVKTALKFTVGDNGYKIGAHYGDAVQAQIDLADAGKHGVAIKTGVIHFGAGKAVLPKAGLRIDGHLDRVSLAEWQQLGGLVGSGNSAGAPQNIDLDLRIGEVNALGQHFHAVHMQMHDTAAGGYRLELAGPDAAGSIVLPAAVDNDHPYAVALDYLHLDSNFAQGHAKQMNLSPTTLPPIKFASQDTQIGKRDLGRLAFKLLQAPGGIVVPYFSATQKALKINMYGTWIVDDNGREHTRIAAAARSDDVGAAFKALGLPAAITAKKARINAELHWPGPPSGDIMKKLGGAITVRLENGRLTEISPGAGRLLSLLSLNALPRHLLFNFSDVFGKGFGYDSIGGTFTIISGNAYTNDFRLKSTVADVHVVGRIGLGKQDYDEDVIIDTSIASTLPIAAAIAGGPVTGVAALLLTQIFKQPLKQATQLEYHVSGSWDKPVMKKVSGAAPTKKANPEPESPGR
ncbi:MAG TPA: YhdP family protein [Gammaproteobacteria bacterium]|nr:YhdP family protein [Gammaproteobacteria bacterium]